MIIDRFVTRMPPVRRPGRQILALVGWALLQPLSPLLADEPPLARKDFRGAWVGDVGHCRWPDHFLLIYDRRSAEFPHRSVEEPSRECRILSVSGKRPEWKLRMSCQNTDPEYRQPKRYEVRQTLRMFGGGYRMIVETEPAPNVPARTEQAYYCRTADEGPPPLICFSVEKGHTYPCEP